MRASNCLVHWRRVAVECQDGGVRARGHRRSTFKVPFGLMQLIDTSKRRSTWRSCGGMYCPTLSVPHDCAPGCRFSQRRVPAVRSDACCCSVREYHYRIRRRAGRNRMRRRLGWCDGQPAWWPQVGGGPLNTHGSDFSMWRPSGAMGHTPLPRECMPLPTAEIRKKSRWSKIDPK